MWILLFTWMSKKATYEIYPFYKKYRHCALDDDAWKDIVESAEAIEKKWNGNLGYAGNSESGE